MKGGKYADVYGRGYQHRHFVATATVDTKERHAYGRVEAASSEEVLRQGERQQRHSATTLKEWQQRQRQRSLDSDVEVYGRR